MVVNYQRRRRSAPVRACSLVRVDRCCELYESRPLKPRLRVPRPAAFESRLSLRRKRGAPQLLLTVAQLFSNSQLMGPSNGLRSSTTSPASDVIRIWTSGLLPMTVLFRV